MRIKYVDSNNNEVVIENELIVKDDIKKEIRVFERNQLVQVIPFLESISIIEFDESDKPLSEIDKLKITQAEQFEAILTLLGGM